MLTKEQQRRIEQFLNPDRLISKEDILILQGDSVDPITGEVYPAKRVMYREKIADSENMVIFHAPAGNGKGEDAYSFCTPIDFERQNSLFQYHLIQGEHSVKRNFETTHFLFGAICPDSPKNGEFVLNMMNPERVVAPGSYYDAYSSGEVKTFKSVSDNSVLECVEKFNNPNERYMLQSELAILQGAYDEVSASQVHSTGVSGEFDPTSDLDFGK